MLTAIESDQTAQASYLHSARKDRLKHSLMVVLMLLPALAVYLLFVLYPMVRAVWYSLYDWNGLGALEDYVGWGNFERILNDDVFRLALRHNLTLIVLSLTIQLPLALLIALLIRGNIKGRAAFRTIFFLPYVLSEVITGVVWTFIYRPQNGLMNAFFGAIWPGYEPQAILADTDKVLYAIFAVITWKFFGFHMILYLAGLQNIPSELEDAARVDGATPFRVLRDVTLPLLGPTFRVSVFFSVLGSLQFFDLIWIMTKGGPVNASNTMATYMYTFGFTRFQLGYGAAVSLVIFSICFVFSILYQRFVMRRDLEGAMS
ncbi:MAG TPA: sugar ABC transporter permease [Thermomicrobiales bacterium]|nr:sugar ABC transporter permease [Thermomicrobiales bacterium]